MLLLSRTEYRDCAVFLTQDHFTRRVYGLYAFTKCLAIEPNVLYCVAGKVNSADKLYLAIESVNRDTRHRWSSTAHAPVDGAEDSAMF